MITRLYSAALHGVEAKEVEVEVNARKSEKPRTIIVGLPDAAVRCVRWAASDVVDLTATLPASVATRPLIAGPVRDDGLRVLRLDDEAEPGDGGIRHLVQLVR